MQEDLYTRWLGIEPGQRPPDHYTLLSLPLFTHTPNAVEAAARAQMEKLDPYAMHPDREQRDASTRMMNEIAQARMLLADPIRREEYDRELAGQRGIEPPGAGGESAMEETIAGGAPAFNAGLDASAFSQPESAELGFQPSGDDAVSDSLFQEQAPLQDMDPSFARPRSRHTTIPFSVAILIGVMVIAAIAGGIVIVAAVLTSEEPKPPPAPPPIVAPPPPPPKQFKFSDTFDSDKLGATYEIRAGSPSHIRVQEGKLILGSADEGPARVDLLARLVRELFREARVTVRVEEGSGFTLGVTRSAKLSVFRTATGMRVRVTPGNLAQTDSLVDNELKLPASDALHIKLVRDDLDDVVWSINEMRVATSPPLKKMKRGYPAVIMQSNGRTGDRVAIDEVHVVYDPEPAEFVE